MATCIDWLGPGVFFCPLDECDNFYDTPIYNRTCECLDYQGHTVPNCVKRDNLYPVQLECCHNPTTGIWQPDLTDAQCGSLPEPWLMETCYCCCLGGGTPGDAALAAPEGPRIMAHVAPGDLALAGSRDGGSVAWAPARVVLSTGAPARAALGRSPIAVRVGLGAGRAPVFAAAQLVLGRSGKLRRADTLRAGADVVLAFDGEWLPVTSVELGSPAAPIHHVAVGDLDYGRFDGSPDGHLVAVAGVVAGDFVTQLYQHTDRMAAHIERVARPNLNEGNGP